jgi:hypothetical protein
MSELIWHVTMSVDGVIRATDGSTARGTDGVRSAERQRFRFAN